MQLVFLGFLFVFLDFNLKLGAAAIGLVPDFVGYILMAKGLTELARFNQDFEKVKPLAVGMAVYTGVLYALDLMSLSIEWAVATYFMGLASVAISLVISSQIVTGILALEAERYWNLEGQKLKSAWTYMAILQGVSAVCGWIPLVGGVGAVAAFVMGLLFLVAFYKTKERYLKMTGTN